MLPPWPDLLPLRDRAAADPSVEDAAKKANLFAERSVVFRHGSQADGCWPESIKASQVLRNSALLLAVLQRYRRFGAHSMLRRDLWTRHVPDSFGPPLLLPFPFFLLPLLLQVPGHAG